MTKKKKTPIRHKVKQHTRKKPTGGKTTIRQYWRGRGVCITPGLVEEIHPGLRKRKVRKKTPKIKWFEFIAPNARTPEEVDITVFYDSEILAGGIDSSWTKHYTYKSLGKRLQEIYELYRTDHEVSVTGTSRYDGHLIARVGK